LTGIPDTSGFFLAKTKTPPTNIVETFLQQHGNTSDTHRTFRTDKGGELWGSYSFQEAILKCNYLLEPTAPDAPFQNGLAERPNQTLATIIRCLLHAAGLGSQYWSFALVHAVYLKTITTQQPPMYPLCTIHRNKTKCQILTHLWLPSYSTQPWSQTT
jgi:hypothetical protein